MCEDHRLNRFTAFTESNENSRHIPQRFHVRRTRMICIDHWKMLPSPPVHFLLLLILSHARSLRHRPNRRGSSLCLKTQYDLPSASSEESGGTWLITFGDFLLCCACALVLFRRRPPSGCRRVCSLIGRFSPYREGPVTRSQSSASSSSPPLLLRWTSVSTMAPSRRRCTASQSSATSNHRL
jgi:hypothetical protein